MYGWSFGPVIKILSWILPGAGVLMMLLGVAGDRALGLYWFFLAPALSLTRVRGILRRPSARFDRCRTSIYPVRPLHSDHWGGASRSSD
ncbi:MAG TPA: hypothetical protein VGD59_15585 [Acidisarcina sp.]